MDEPHGAEHEQLLERALVGELSDAAPELRELLGACPACADAWRDLADTRSLLDERAREERADRELAAALASAPGEDDVAAHVRAVRAQDDAALVRPPARRGPGIALAAAAAGLALLVAWRVLAPRGERARAGDGALEAVAPAGDVERYAPFRWRGVRSPAGWYRVVVRADGPAPAGELLSSDTLTATSWTPAPAALDALPDAIAWVVRLEDARGLVAESTPARARRLAR